MLLHNRFYMDSNVSKNTFCQKLLKLAVKSDNLAVKKLLKQHILTTITAYERNNCLKSEFIAIETMIADKLTLCNLKKSSALNIVYRCAIAFPLANQWHLPPTTIAHALKEFLLTTNVTSTTRPILKFTVKVVSSGWLDFEIGDCSSAIWLEEVVRWVNKQQRSRDLEEQGFRPAIGQDSFFEIQYAHARCCSLLRLGHQEKLIRIKHNYSVWEIIEPDTITWIDEGGVFWLTNPTEKRLLIELLTVVDNLTSNLENPTWVRLAQSLSSVFLDFWANCRIYGEVKQKTPDLAQARLGLVALVQYFLSEILRNKLYVCPLTEI